MTSCAICGSDLHLFDNFIPGMMSGDIMGHEFMGEVVEVGKGEHGKLKIGDRVVVPVHHLLRRMRPVQARQLFRLRAHQPQQGNRRQSVRPRHRRPVRLHPSDRRLPRRPGRIRAGTRTPISTHVKIPDGLTDEQVLFLGDIFPTGWQAAVQCDIQPTDTVAVWGCGPVGQMAIRSAFLLGAKQVVASIACPSGWRWPKPAARSPINFEDESVLDGLNELTNGKGPEKCIDAVGMESHATRSPDSHL